MCKAKTHICSIRRNWQRTSHSSRFICYSTDKLFIAVKKTCGWCIPQIGPSTRYIVCPLRHIYVVRQIPIVTAIHYCSCAGYIFIFCHSSFNKSVYTSNLKTINITFCCIISRDCRYYAACRLVDCAVHSRCRGIII